MGATLVWIILSVCNAQVAASSVGVVHVHTYDRLVVVVVVVWALRLDVEWCKCALWPRCSNIHEHPRARLAALSGADLFAFAWLRASTNGSFAPGDQRADPGRHRPTTAAQAGLRCTPPALVELLDEVWRTCSQCACSPQGSWPLSSSSRKIHPPPTTLPPVWPLMALAPWSPWRVANWAHCTRPQKGSVEHEGPGS
jgi:hypothetical protein